MVILSSRADGENSNCLDYPLFMLDKNLDVKSNYLMPANCTENRTDICPLFRTNLNQGYDMITHNLLTISDNDNNVVFRCPIRIIEADTMLKNLGYTPLPTRVRRTADGFVYTAGFWSDWVGALQLGYINHTLPLGNKSRALWLGLEA